MVALLYSSLDRVSCMYLERDQTCKSQCIKNLVNCKLRLAFQHIRRCLSRTSGLGFIIKSDRFSADVTINIPNKLRWGMY